MLDVFWLLVEAFNLVMIPISANADEVPFMNKLTQRIGDISRKCSNQSWFIESVYSSKVNLPNEYDMNE